MCIAVRPSRFGVLVHGQYMTSHVIAAELLLLSPEAFKASDSFVLLSGMLLSSQYLRIKSVVVDVLKVIGDLAGDG